jgi:hypothetical protein
VSLGANDDDCRVANTSDECLVVRVLEELYEKAVVIVLPNQGGGMRDLSVLAAPVRDVGCQYHGTLAPERT